MPRSVGAKVVEKGGGKNGSGGGYKGGGKNGTKGGFARFNCGGPHYARDCPTKAPGKGGGGAVREMQSPWEQTPAQPTVSWDAQIASSCTQGELGSAHCLTTIEPDDDDSNIKLYDEPEEDAQNKISKSIKKPMDEGKPEHRTDNHNNITKSSENPMPKVNPVLSPSENKQATETIGKQNVWVFIGETLHAHFVHLNK